MATLTIPNGGTGMVLVSNNTANVTWSTTQPQEWVHPTYGKLTPVNLLWEHEVEVDFE